MSTPVRTFEDKPAVRESVPLLLGLAGASGSGKTWSMLRLLTGMQRVINSEIGIVDTEHKRALQYADYFKFRHVAMTPPFGPLDYLAAIEYLVGKGITLIGVDSLTHEHSGEGGVMDQSDRYLERFEDENAKQRNFMASLKGPKLQRKRLNNAIVQMGINAVFCYRATDRIKPVPGAGIQHIGWQPETTSPLVYEMVQCFLLPPGCDGKPELNPKETAERMLTKTPAQFREWFKPGFQLNEDLGQKMAEWARGGVTAPPPPAAETPDLQTLIDLGASKAKEGIAFLEGWWKSLTPAQRVALKDQLPKWKELAG